MLNSFSLDISSTQKNDVHHHFVHFQDYAQTLSTIEFVLATLHDRINSSRQWYWVQLLCQLRFLYLPQHSSLPLLSSTPKYLAKGSFNNYLPPHQLSYLGGQRQPAMHNSSSPRPQQTPVQYSFSCVQFGCLCCLIPRNTLCTKFQK